MCHTCSPNPAAETLTFPLPPGSQVVGPAALGYAWPWHPQVVKRQVFGGMPAAGVHYPFCLCFLALGMAQGVCGSQCQQVGGMSMSTLPFCCWYWGLVSPVPAPSFLQVRARHWPLGHALHPFHSPDVGLVCPPDLTCRVYASHGGYNWRGVPTILLVVLARALLSSGFVG